LIPHRAIAAVSGVLLMVAAVVAGPAPAFAAAVPDAPTGVTALAGDGQATVSWTAPADNGDPITGYTVSWSGGSQFCSGSQCDVTGLTNGTSYAFTAAATNGIGTGPDSSPSDPVTPAGLPGAPTNVTATGGGASASVSWTAPADNGSAISGYTVSWSGGTLACSASPCAITGLTNGTSYTFTVAAINGVGTGPDSGASSAVTPSAVPDAPTGVAATRGDTSASVTWTAPADNGSAITGYTVGWSGGSHACAGSPCVITGLTNGVSYTFTVAATNGVGTGPDSAPSNAVTPAAVPDAPSSVSAAGGNASATVTWTAPADNGSAITGYTFSWSGSNQGCAASPCLITGLTNGTSYTFTVAATNGAGTGPDSTPSNSVTPAAVPDAPSGASATAGDTQATVSWTAPNDNGSAITGYTLTWSSGSQACPGSPCVISGLTNGTSYTFTVDATNAVGTGPDSAPSNPVTPAAVPDAPTGVSATGGDGSATVTWTAPADNGSAITTYTVSWSGGSQACAGSPCLITGLTNGTSYTFAVTATNGVGTGPASGVSNAVTPAGEPDAPASVSATAGNSSATVTWIAPNDNGSTITGYTVSWSGGTQSCSGSPCLVTGLTNGTSYAFTVTATNGVGTGPASSASNSVTPAAAPDAPTNVSATGGNASATVTWTAPNDNGNAFTGYTVTWASGTKSCSGSPCTVTGLTNGTSYTFTVAATNAVGTGPASTASNAVTPATVPDAPTNVAATRGNASATVTWTAPANNGSSITDYTVSWSGGTKSCSGSPCGVTGLTNGTSYTFTVAAINAVGTGPASSASNAVTPANVPNAPTNVSATAGVRSAIVSFTAPSDNGSPITGYTAGWTGGSSPCSGSPCAITGLADGTSYQFSVTATNAVGTGPASAPSNRVLTFSPGAACNGASLSPSGQSVVAGQTAALDAAAAGCTDPQFEFWVRYPDGKWHMLRPWGGPTFDWTTTGLAPGSYRVHAWVAQSGHSTSGWEVYAAADVTLTGCASASVTPPTATQQSGSAVDLTARAAGCPNPLYEFWLGYSNGRWLMKQAFSADPTFHFETAGLVAGRYLVRVWASHQGASIASWEAYGTSVVTVTAGPCTAADLSPPSVSQDRGTTVVLNASSTFCLKPMYEYWVLYPNNKWYMKRAFSSDPTWSWDTTALQPGHYRVHVWASNQAPTMSGWESYGVATVTLTGCTSASLAPKSATSGVGLTMTFTASSTGCVNPHYQFWVQYPDKSWHMKQGWGGPAFSWSLPFTPGTLVVSVWVTHNGSGADTWETYASSTVVTNRCGAAANPWNYNFCTGNLITNPASAFCYYFLCTSNFGGGSGYVVQCNDGRFSSSGGGAGACSLNGGVKRPLYSP
jgi:Fibronectin type III domain